MRRVIIWLIFYLPATVWAQRVVLDPVISPVFFRHNDVITVTYDVTGTPLASLNNAWAWVWIPGPNINSRYNINPATSAADPAKFTKSINAGRTIFTLSFKPTDFFTQNITSYNQLGILLKANDWPAGQTSDYLATFWDGNFRIALTSPLSRPLFVNTNDNFTISAEIPVNGSFQLFINGSLVSSPANVRNLSYTHTVTETAGYGTVVLRASQGTNFDQVEFQYLLRTGSPTQSRPPGIIPGINYSPDPTRVTLCLQAPGKNSVYVRGDFSNWDVLPQNLMKKDGEFFWIELTGLTPGQEYAFQYLVNETLWIADPYADKILDPDDQYIPATTYPGLKPYPTKARSAFWYFNRVSVFQTAQTPYVWQSTGYQRPDKKKLVVYELLIRDFFDSGNRNYQNLIDTLSYFKRLGINAIELMPVMEFNGNEGWGYNPTFMFAPDKYYGTKNKLKEFIDKCHQNNIAVILDIALNHHDIPNPMAMLDFDFTNYTPTANNKWFNVTARHPFNVFYDMNHESPYTKAYVDTICYYWLNEYKVDGFRFDLSKGFTQVNSGNNVDLWSAYDPSRIALLKRMADKIWSHTPDAIIILEHFAVNTEEKELAEYRANEGKGMLLWGNLHYAYNQNTMGYSDNSSLDWVYHGTRGWTVPHVVSYMESHDEERLMYNNITHGNAASGYSTRNRATALDRMRGAATIFYTIPGPKMLWQFGELGYDFSINHCVNGTVNNNCRLDPKPVKWDYRQEGSRYLLYRHIADLIRLRNTYSVFHRGTATFSGANNLLKQLTLRNAPYTATPSSPEQMNVHIVVNFDVVSRTAQINFPHSGTWYDYYSFGTPVSVSALPYTLQLRPGEYRLFTDVEISNPLITEIPEESSEELAVYPNPTEKVLYIEASEPVLSVSATSVNGKVYQPLRTGDAEWSIEQLPAGLYVISIYRSGKPVKHVRIIKP
ncbi:MAG: alpha-amylase family glycosyl hydrolase [Cyclobacteriaceae bacterium]|nr:alpha-amylase family glycosyl hydrolase [Cyclobacteriaceae bacterium]